MEKLKCYKKNQNKQNSSVSDIMTTVVVVMWSMMWFILENALSQFVLILLIHDIYVQLCK